MLLLVISGDFVIGDGGGDVWVAFTDIFDLNEIIMKK